MESPPGISCGIGSRGLRQAPSKMRDTASRRRGGGSEPISGRSRQPGPGTRPREGGNGMDFELSEEQRMWRLAVHDFCAQEVRPSAAEMDVKAEFNEKAVRKMAPLGLLGLMIPEEYGGAGVDAISAAIAIEELGWADGGTALSIAAHNGLGCAPIVLFGSEEQKRRWLPPLARGGGRPRRPR